MTKRVSFEILEPLIFKSSSEFAPGVSGPHARAESVPFPYPATAAGTLSTLVLERMTQRVLPSGDWDDQMSGLIGREAKLRGPYLLSDENKIFVQHGEAILEVDDALRRARSELEEASNEDEEPEKSIVNSIEVAGVRLTNEKATEEKMLYFAKMVDYAPKGARKAICFDLIGRSNLESIEFPKIVKFGGEGRATRVSISESGDTLVSLIEKKVKNAGALYVASPIVFKTGAPKNEDPEEKVNGVIKGALRGIDAKRIVGKVDLLGTGFLTARVQRKPIYAAIFPGSVIELEDGSTVSREICESGLGEFSQLGYGTVIPFS